MKKIDGSKNLRLLGVNRIKFIVQMIILIGSMSTVFAGSSGTSVRDNSKKAWKRLNEILVQINSPKFPERDFPITDYGAKGDGVTDCSGAFENAMNDCHKQGGGRVIVPAGKYSSKAIHLKSNVNLHLEKGAEILFSTNPSNYLPVVYSRWEGVELMNYSPLIYACDQNNIAITGDGTLNGQADNSNWWSWKGQKNFGWKEGMPSQLDKDNRSRLFALAEEDVPVEERIFGESYYLRPPFFQPYQCKNILIEGVTLINSPMWVLNPVLCENLTIRDLTIKSMGPNSDNCDPESCKNVLIENCEFSSGDDCIAIKSGRNADGRRINKPSENIVIRNCFFNEGHGGIVLGSETSGGVKNIYVENCRMDSPNLLRVLRIKTSSMRGGITENVFVRNIDVGSVRDQVIRINLNYENSGPYPPVVRNIYIENLKVQNGGKTGILLEGLEESPVENVILNNINIKNVKENFKFNHVKNIRFKNVIINDKMIDLNN